MRQIELLSPARNADCGIEAILHGADAVYIGGPSFSARAAAGNSVEDIARLCRFAHLYGARIYITLNTILHDDELSEAERMVHELYQAGVDALIVQDLGLLRLDLPPIALHASTQMDNRTPEQARRLEALGFSQIVVARELSLTDIRAISQATPLPLEAFVHGALCVSYSGQCYASQYCFGRSANRGCCAQFCRLAFDLVDSEGRTVIRDKHLLSLRDMNRLNSLEAMMDAGVSSFKIEGRLKEAGYVKNVTAAYRQAIDKILERRAADYCRSSYGRSTLTFTPQPEKSFNRGFTEYFLHDRRTPMHSFDTPKAMGEAIGEVNRVERRAFTIHPAKPSPSSDGEICAGDGLCYIDPDGHLQGFRVNRVDPDGRILPATMPPLRKGTKLFRNYDQAFDRQLSRPSAKRRLRLSIHFSETEAGYLLRLCDESGCSVSQSFEAENTEARTPQREAILQTLSRLGDTPFELTDTHLELSGERFIPSSQLAAWRRSAVEALIDAHHDGYRRDRRRPTRPESAPRLPRRLDYSANILNRLAADMAKAMGAEDIAPALEALPRETNPGIVMTCRYCLMDALGCCLKKAARPTWRMPLSLRLPDGRRFPLRFDCKNCQMLVYAPED